MTIRDPSDKEIGQLIERISGLARLGQFQQVDLMLQTTEIEMTSVVIIITLARTTYAMRHKLMFWDAFVRRAHEVLSARGRDADALLRGLLS